MRNHGADDDVWSSRLVHGQQEASQRNGCGVLDRVVIRPGIRKITVFRNIRIVETETT